MKNSLLILGFLGLTACKMPFLYQQSIIQGNQFTQEQIKKLTAGLDKEEVHKILGDPLIDNPLNKEQESYIFTLKSEQNRSYRKKLIIYYDEQNKIKKIRSE